MVHGGLYVAQADDAIKTKANTAHIFFIPFLLFSSSCASFGRFQYALAALVEEPSGAIITIPHNGPHQAQPGKADLTRSESRSALADQHVRYLRRLFSK